MTCTLISFCALCLKKGELKAEKLLFSPSEAVRVHHFVFYAFSVVSSHFLCLQEEKNDG